jgi:hypothetical protein
VSQLNPVHNPQPVFLMSVLILFSH